MVTGSGIFRPNSMKVVEVSVDSSSFNQFSSSLMLFYSRRSTLGHSAFFDIYWRDFARHLKETKSVCIAKPRR